MKTGITATGHEKSNLSGSRQGNDRMPKVLIDYLFSLIKTDREISGCRHIFRLGKGQLGGEEIQDIFHTGENKAIAIHRVFGYKPLTAEIIVICDGTNYYMSLSNDAFAADGPTDSRIETKMSFLAAAACNI
ncbi:hypothetical protein CAFE_24740 [Caprobacter fermentans]|uniref:Uncharacterized protein n=1 Tax=Caproicibacter fermentans TaxID=2576756 RepID=A0A6N8I1B0_9FIRM|nr:hypothetical protein [Caproicibacter fermentans]MVB11749.1 hypothetical protein [Caproicibacter fermentans]